MYPQLENRIYDWSIIRMSHVLGKAGGNINMDVSDLWNFSFELTTIIMKPLSAADFEHILLLLDSGHSHRQISSQIGVSRSASPDYALDIVLTLRKPLEVAHPSFLTPMFVMPFILLVLGKLIMLPKSPNISRTSPTNLFVYKQFEMG